MLALSDLEKLKTQDEVKKHVSESFEVKIEELQKYDFLISYESVGSWGCDSSNYFLLRDTNDGQLYENAGAHCSCFGFEGQWDPRPVSIEYLKSDIFYVSMGGYDPDDDINLSKIKKFIELIDAEIGVKK